MQEKSTQFVEDLCLGVNRLLYSTGGLRNMMLLSSVDTNQNAEVVQVSDKYRQEIRLVNSPTFTNCCICSNLIFFSTFPFLQWTEHFLQMPPFSAYYSPFNLDLSMGFQAKSIKITPSCMEIIIHVTNVPWLK